MTNKEVDEWMIFLKFMSITSCFAFYRLYYKRKQDYRKSSLAINYSIIK